MRDELRWTALTTTAQVAAFAATVNFGIVAVAAGSSAVMVLAWPLRLVLVGRWSGVRARACGRLYAGPAVATVVMGLGVLTVGWALSGLSRTVVMVAEILTGAVVYPIALRVLAPSAFREMLGVLQLLRPAAPDGVAPPGTVREP